MSASDWLLSLVDGVGDAATALSGAVRRGGHEEGLPAKADAPRVVSLVPGECLAWSGSFCSTCYERCPVPGAIAVDAGRPLIDPHACDGCGECVRRCPAPFVALVLVERVGV